MWITPIRIGSYLMIYWFGEMWIMWINKIFHPIHFSKEVTPPVIGFILPHSFQKVNQELKFLCKICILLTFLRV